jgi:hydrogenase maturation protease
MSPPRVLVAGVGNIFLGDDGFGVEVARRLAAADLPEGVEVADFGIRGVHLAYQLLDGYDLVVLVDATPRGGEPGSVYVIEPTRSAGADAEQASMVDAHDMEPGAVLALLEALGGTPGRVLVVGCEPAEVTERIGLSEPVAGAVDRAAEVVRELVMEVEPGSTQATTPRRG